MKNKIIVAIVFIAMFIGLYFCMNWVYNQGYQAGVSTQLYNFKVDNKGVPCKFL